MIDDSKRAQPRFKGMSDAVRTIVREEGLSGVYRGVVPVVSLCTGLATAAILWASLIISFVGPGRY